MSQNLFFLNKKNWVDLWGSNRQKCYIKLHKNDRLREKITSCLLRPAEFSFSITSAETWRYFSDRGSSIAAIVWTSAFTSWAEPEDERRDWALPLTSSIWTDAGLLLIAVRKRRELFRGRSRASKRGSAYLVWKITANLLLFTVCETVFVKEITD